MVDIPLDGMIKLLGQASLGKLIEGLIHNINGPMQNLGLDIEMTMLLIEKGPQPDQDFFDNIKSRIKRIEQEFNRLDLLIKTTSIRSELNFDMYKKLNISDFLEQELQHLHANLYFKHNVQTNLTPQDDPPMVNELPANFPLALAWILQSVVKELENMKVKVLNLETCSEDARLEMAINTQEGGLSEGFSGLLNHDFTGGIPRDGNHDIATVLALMIFNSEGVDIDCRFEESGSNIRISAPILKEQH